MLAQSVLLLSSRARAVLQARWFPLFSVLGPRDRPLGSSPSAQSGRTPPMAAARAARRWRADDHGRMPPASTATEFAGFSGFEPVIRRFGGIASRRELLRLSPLSETDFWFALHYGRLDRIRQGWYASSDLPADARAAWVAGGPLACVSALAHYGMLDPGESAEQLALHICLPADGHVGGLAAGGLTRRGAAPSAHLRAAQRRRVRTAPDRPSKRRVRGRAERRTTTRRRSRGHRRPGRAGRVHRGRARPARRGRAARPRRASRR